MAQATDGKDTVEIPCLAGSNSVVCVKEEKLDLEIEQKICALKKANAKTADTECPDKKDVKHAKSSKEILTELFQVFNAKPPPELLDDASLLHKFKKKLKRRSATKDEKSVCRSSKKKKKKEKHTERGKAHKKDKRRHRSPHVEDKKNVDEAELKHVHRDEPRRSDHGHCEGKTEHKCPNPFRRNECVPSRAQSRSPSRSRSRSWAKRKKNDDFSDISLSDEESFAKEKTFGGKSATRCIGERRRHNNFYEGNQRHTATRFRYRSRSPSQSRSSPSNNVIDKKRLLEIATKNAIIMLKEGRLPAFVNMSDATKNKILQMVHKDDKSVEDLTDFCKKLSQGGDATAANTADFGLNESGKRNAFHHPFQVKDREPVVMRITAPTTIGPAIQSSQDKVKAITLQFPVSSGQQHRMSEVWTPVVDRSNKEKSCLKHATSTKQPMSKNVFDKSISAKQQEPAFKPLSNTTSLAPQHVEVANPLADPSPVPLVGVATPFMSGVPIKSIPPATPNVDAYNVITSRLEAIRMLQVSPDNQPTSTVGDHSYSEMPIWSNTNGLMGQFTGSTGANILTSRQLSSGTQVWARRDQMKRAKPLNGGVGMALLQKMGWKPGEGLGRERNGALQPLLLDVKLDKRGLVTKEENGYKSPIALPQISMAPEMQQNKGANTAKPVFCPNLEASKHPVSLLNELTYKYKWERPIYQITDVCGPMHNCFFRCSVTVNGLSYTPDVPSSTKKESRLNAAKLCLQTLGIHID